MKSRLLIPIAQLSLSVGLCAAAIPFLENFDSYDNTANPSIIPTGFSETPASDWTIQNDGTGKDYQHAITEINSTTGTVNLSLYSSTVPITNVVGNNFTMSAKMTIDAASATSTNSNNKLIVGLNFLGNVGFSPGYTAEVVILGAGIAGTIRISEDDVVRASAPFSGAISFFVPYTLTLTASYSGASNLTINFTLSGGANSTTISFTDTTPRTGQLFGFRDLVGTNPQSTVSLNVDYDNLVIVPEPTSAGLLGAAIGACALRRRRISPIPAKEKTRIP